MEQKNKKLFYSSLNNYKKNRVNLISLDSINYSQSFIMDNKKLNKTINTISNFSNSNKLKINCSVKTGNSMYEKGLISKSKSLNKLNNIKLEKEKKIKEECTFKPKLNDSSYFINLKSNVNKKNKININDDSTKSESGIIRRVKSSSEINIQTSMMYRMAQKIEEKKENLRREYYVRLCPFRPIVNDKSPPHINNFFNRLQGWIEKCNKNYLNNNQKSNIDSKTGLKFFNPDLEKTQKVNEMFFSARSNKFEKLYNDSKQKLFKLSLINENNEKSIKKLSNTSFISPNSHKMSEEMVDKIFNKIYDKLTNSTMINIDKYTNISSLPDKLCKIMEPLFEELINQNESLKYEEFLSACRQLYNYLNIEEKNKLISWYYEKENKVAEFTFKPKIDKNSLNLAKYRYSEDFYKKACEVLDSNNVNDVINIYTLNKLITEKKNLEKKKFENYDIIETADEYNLSESFQ